MSNSNPAVDYETFTVPARFVPLLPSLLDIANSQPGETALDVGCGTGIVARAIAPLVRPAGHVTGIDLSPEMLAVARRAAEQEGVNVTWVEGSAETMPFSDQSFDLVVCQQTLQFIPDKHAALCEMFRVMNKRGGRLVLNVWQGLDQHPFPAQFYAVLGRHLNVGGLDQAYTLGNCDTLVELIEKAGFREIKLESVRSTACFPDPDDYLVQQVASSVASNPAIQHLSSIDRAELTALIQEEMTPVVQKHVKNGELVFDQAVHLLYAEC